jgi:signal transduction histidine kinase
LIHNAIKFTQRGKVTVSVRFADESGNGAGVKAQRSGMIPRAISGEPAANWLQIEVTDTGAGIPDHALP